MAGDHAGVAVHEHLRRLILQGVLRPGRTLNQVELARMLGVSPTPIREALRMLQEEGLVEAEPQKRARVAAFYPSQLESVYVQRIFLESFGARLTAAASTEAKVEELDEHLRSGARVARRGMEEWQAFNRRFHLAVVERLGPDLLAVARRLIDRSDHYLLSRMYRAGGPAAWSTADMDWATVDVEHEAIVEAFRTADGSAVAAIVARHLGRTACAVIGELAPDYAPDILEQAIATVVGGDGRPPDSTGRVPVQAPSGLRLQNL
ncbi:MAG TPA: GntR family transcriptional regulator [Solirubrobacteraceae bacterium]|nr:GntR family transcriptional regulator [Solirubrobacteraceae bacterium]